MWDCTCETVCVQGGGGVCGTVHVKLCVCREEEACDPEACGGVWYYSTRLQLQELLSQLDPAYWEADLVCSLEEQMQEIHHHMDVTMELTCNARKHNPDFLSAANGNQACPTHTWGHKQEHTHM